MFRRGKENRLWTRIFGIKIGDQVRFKYGKVTWECYAVERFDNSKYSEFHGHIYWKLRRKRKSHYLFNRETIYKTVWDFQPEAKEMIKVEV